TARRWGWSTSKGLKHSGGKEFLELNFNRTYAFETTVTMWLRAAETKRGKLLPTGYRAPAAREGEDPRVIYLLAQPEALEQYADGNVPISDAQLRDVLGRWSRGTTHLNGSLVARVLNRWHSSRPELELRAWAERLAQRHRMGHTRIGDPAVQNALTEAFG